MRLLIFPIALALLEFGVFLSNDAYLPALPSIMQDLDLNQALAQQTLFAWFLGSASIQLFIGPLSDRFGRRPVVLLGAILFVISSFICVVTNNFILFILARFMQGSTVCSTIVGGYASIHESYDGKRAIQIVAIMGSITILAPAIGPLFGAFLLHVSHDWRWIFYILAIWGSIITAVLWFKMPETLKNPSELHLIKNLLSYKDILCNKSWLKYAVMSAMFIFGFFIWIVASPFLLIVHYHLSVLEFGYAQSIIFSGFIFGMQLCGKLIDKYPVNRIIFGFCSLAVFFSLLSVIEAWHNEVSVWLLVFYMAVIAIGVSGANTPLSRLAVESSDAPMGQKVAMYSLFFSVSAAFAAFMGGVINPEQALPILVFGLSGYLIAGGILFFNYAHIVLKNQ